MAKEVQQRSPDTPVAVNFADSASVAGLQVAYVVTNTAFQAQMVATNADFAEALPTPLRIKGCLIMRPVEIADGRPAWLRGA